MKTLLKFLISNVYFLLTIYTGYDGKGRVMPIIDWKDLQVAASIASSS